jgi:predicted RNA-binding Zn-ribbon protein involved in translation (DUF1610 family)
MTALVARKNEKKRLEFTCPKCGGRHIMEHLVNYESVFIYEDGEIETGGTEWWESDKVEYSCSDCFWTIRDEDQNPIRDEASLIRWLRKEPKAESYRPNEIGGRYDEVDLESEENENYAEPGLLRFECPQCGGERLEAVNYTATYLNIYDDGSVEYPKAYGGEIDHFRCHACRWIVEDDEHGRIDDPEILASWLKDKCEQNNSEDD